MTLIYRYDNKRETYYYHNNLTAKTQWEHPLDEIYRDLVFKKRAESQSFSLGDPTEDATYNKDELLSYEEPAREPIKKLEPISLGARKKEIKLSPVKANSITGNEFNTNDVPTKLAKQMSEDRSFNRKIGLQMFNSFDDKREINVENSIITPEKGEFSLSGGGSMFLKSKKPPKSSPGESRNFAPSPEPSQQPRSILRERSYFENSKSLELDKSLGDKSEKDDDDKKSVRFNLDTTGDITFDFSEKSGSEEETKYPKNETANDVINVKLTQNKQKTRFTVSPVDESVLKDDDNEINNLKLVKPYPTDFIKPTLKVTNSLDNSDILHTSESEDDSVLKDKFLKKNKFLDPNNSFNETKKTIDKKEFTKENENDIDSIKTELWEEKNQEIELYKENLQKSHKHELERILQSEKLMYEDNIKKELENLRNEMKNRNVNALKIEKETFENQLEKKREEVAKELELEEEEFVKKIKESFEMKRKELETKYENKLLELEKELDIKHELNRTQIITDHNAILEQLKENHTVIIENLKREFTKEVCYVISFFFCMNISTYDLKLQVLELF